jgi:hypothetical protein
VKLPTNPSFGPVTAVAIATVEKAGGNSLGKNPFANKFLRVGMVG